MSIYPFTCLSIYLSTYLSFIHPSIHLSIHHTSFHPFIIQIMITWFLFAHHMCTRRMTVKKMIMMREMKSKMLKILVSCFFSELLFFPLLPLPVTYQPILLDKHSDILMVWREYCTIVIWCAVVMMVLLLHNNYGQGRLFLWLLLLLPEIWLT